MSEVITCSKLLKMIDELDTASEQQKFEMKIKCFNKLIKWTDKDYEQYERLINRVRAIKKTSINKCKKTKKDENGVTTRYIGDALEDIVNFIFEKSFFYKVYPNMRSAINEIDQFIVLSEKGKMALGKEGFSEYMLINKENFFL